MDGEKYVWQCIDERAESTERGARRGIGGGYEDENGSCEGCYLKVERCVGREGEGDGEGCGAYAGCDCGC